MDEWESTPQAPRKAAREILEHMLHNPEARDTAIGIHQWWLRRQIEFSPGVIREALRLLVRHGTVIENFLADGNAVYSISQAGRAEGRVLLDRIHPGPGTTGTNR